MFEQVFIREFNTGEEIDIGLLAETLLYYQNTRLVLNPDTTLKLMKRLGFDVLVRLLESGHVRASYFPDYFASMNGNANGITVHTPVQFQMAGHGDLPSKPWGKEEQLHYTFTRAGYDKITSRKYVRKLSKLLPKERLAVAGNKINVCEMVAEDLLDNEYALAAAKAVVESRLPGIEIPRHWTFKFHRLNEGFAVETNFEFDSINARYRQKVPEDTLTSAHVQAEILATRVDLTFAAKHSSELVTSPLRSTIMQKKLSLLTLRRENAISEIDLFQNVHLEGKNLRHAINSGTRTFTELLDLLEESRRFKDWLKGANPEVSLLREYHEAVNKIALLDRLPSKASRFGLMTSTTLFLDSLGGGGIWTLAGLGLSAADAFLLDPLLKGWRPNQFVENNLKTFVHD